MAYEDVYKNLKITKGVRFGSGAELQLHKNVELKRFDLPVTMAEHLVEQRISKVETFNQPPGLVADRTSATDADREVVNRDFLLAGLNMTSVLCTPDANGGILMTPAGGNTDGALIKPHATKISSWTDVVWNTGKNVRFSTRIKTGAKIASLTIVAGLKLTDTTVLATDNDQSMFYFKDSGNWRLVSSNNGTDENLDSGIACAINTEYEFVIEVNESRIPKYYIDNVLVGTGAALKANTNLIPVIALLSSTDASTTKTLAIRYLACSRDY
jgi:hypothetical protein